jgi:hypothetical protein
MKHLPTCIVLAALVLWLALAASSEYPTARYGDCQTYEQCR